MAEPTKTFQWKGWSENERKSCHCSKKAGVTERSAPLKQILKIWGVGRLFDQHPPHSYQCVHLTVLLCLKRAPLRPPASHPASDLWNPAESCSQCFWFIPNDLHRHLHPVLRGRGPAGFRCFPANNRSESDLKAPLSSFCPDLLTPESDSGMLDTCSPPGPTLDTPDVKESVMNSSLFVIRPFRSFC